VFYGTTVSDMSAPENVQRWAGGGFTSLIGLALEETGPDRVTGSVPITADLLQPYGILHGGVLCSIVETLASFGGAIWYGDRGHVVGVSNSTDFLRATRTGTVHAVATPIHRGRSSQLWLVEITDDEGRAVARGQVRLANLDDAGKLAAPAATGAESPS
jgi:1,4-dihydroxy-2-naphthoyl-CoA hydrolase